MPDPQTAQELEHLRRWVETWRRAGRELEAIRRREIETIDTREAIRPTSGPVEQQAWFAKLRR